ncbi:MAG: sulfotransferase, partial [Deltaproteobacteria bacterium]
RIFSRIRQREHATVFSEKTPWNVLIFEDLIQLLPGCRCIFMLRDPRAIAASLMEVGEKHQKIGFRPLPFTTSLLKAIDKTKECFESGFRAVRQYPERVLVVRYEDFVSDPEKECRRICAFLDLPWREEMLDFESKSDSLIARLPGIWNDRERLTGRIDRQSLEKWKSVLTPVQQALVTDAFQGMVELREAGYQLEPIRLGLIQRFRVSVVKAFVFHRSALIRSRARLKDTLKKSRQIRKFYYAVFK